MAELITPDTRWFPIPENAKTHSVQTQLEYDLENKLFSEYIIAAGRRSYKTERFLKRTFVKSLITEGSNQVLFLGAPTRQQAKAIFWKDIKLLTPKYFIKKLSESELSIETLDNNNTLQVVGLKEFKRIQGQLCHKFGITEYQECEPEVWTESIEPMLIDTGGIAVKEGRPSPAGKNHFYDDYLKGLKRILGKAASYFWKSEDILTPQQIEKAKEDLGKQDYEREYEASFETAGTRPYYAYSINNNRKWTPLENIPLIVTCDFNATEKPMSWNIGQRIKQNNLDVTYWIKSLQFQFTGTETMCGILEDYFQEMKIKLGWYPKTVYFYGDYSGKSEKSNSRYSDWDLISNYFRSKFRMEQKLKFCKSIVDSIACTNAQLCNTKGEIRQFVDPDECNALVRDFDYVQWAENRKELSGKDPMLGHASRATDYFNNYEFDIRQITATQ